MDFLGELGSFISAFGSLCIAGAVGLIAYRQSVTARQKLALDLFDKRFELYRELTTAVAEAMTQSGKHSLALAAGKGRTDLQTAKVALVFSEAAKTATTQQQKAAFLFGDDVLDVIGQMVNDLRLAALGYSKPSEDFLDEALERLADSHIRLKRTCGPYMRMTYKIRAVF